VVDFISRDGAELAVFPLMQVLMLPAGRLSYRCVCEIDMYSCLSLANGISAALEYLHGNCIVHRDVKPDNVLYDSVENIFVLSDFGSATILPASSIGVVAESPATVAFYPPEVCIVEAAPTYNAFSADLWALGMTIYCSIFRKLPYFVHSDSYVELVDEIAKFVDPYPIIDQVADFSVRDVLVALLADRRYLKQA
jgi:serine/threonine protein kinase